VSIDLEFREREKREGLDKARDCFDFASQ